MGHPQQAFIYVIQVIRVTKKYHIYPSFTQINVNYAVYFTHLLPAFYE